MRAALFVSVLVQLGSAACRSSQSPAAAGPSVVTAARPAVPSPVTTIAASVDAAPPVGYPAVPWWHSAVFYEVYPRSFKDTNGDGVGDLPGITSKLDYLADLGVDAIWITPFYPSPQVDFGYDISDYENVDPQYGTLADFDRLLAEAHARHIRIVADLVLNHTSDKHPFFVASRSSRTSPIRDFYIWHDPVRGGPPNNWRSNFEPSAWAFDQATGQFYYHAFYAQQPDLNWRNPAVEQAMFKSAQFWLARGVDAFRLDAITELYEDPLLRDNPPSDAGAGRQIHLYTSDLPECHVLLRRLRTVVNAYAGDRILIGEAYESKASELLPYYGPNDDEVQLPFNFLLLQVKRLDAGEFRAHINDIEGALAGRPTNYVLGNHDNPRSWDHFGDGRHDEAIAKILALMMLTLRGAPFLYYGEEIGMVTTDPATREDVRDPIGLRYWPRWKGRDGERTPMQWDGTASAGFTTGKPWLPVPPSASTRNVAAEARDPHSLLNLYRRIIRLRRQNAALYDGDYMDIGDDPHVLAYLRKGGGSTFLVALNMSDENRLLPIAHVASANVPMRIVLSTSGERSESMAAEKITLDPFEGILMTSSP